MEHKLYSAQEARELTEKALQDQINERVAKEAAIRQNPEFISKCSEAMSRMNNAIHCYAKSGYTQVTYCIGSDILNHPDPDFRDIIFHQVIATLSCRGFSCKRSSYSNNLEISW